MLFVLAMVHGVAMQFASWGCSTRTAYGQSYSPSRAFTFEGLKTVQRLRVALVAFREQTVPRLLRTADDAAAEGRFWIEPPAGPTTGSFARSRWTSAELSGNRSDGGTCRGRSSGGASSGAAGPPRPARARPA